MTLSFKARPFLVVPVLAFLITVWPGSDRAGGQTFEIAHVFPYGGRPASTLIQAKDGFYYGTTTAGGSSDRGTVFRIDAAGNLVTLHEFHDFDGANPRGALLEASDGYFYGTTYNEGPNGGAGTVFRMDHAGNVTTLHEFQFDDEGAFARGALIEASDGFLYGATAALGTTFNGTIYRLSTAGDFAVIHDFSGAGGLLEISPGVFLGTGGPGDYGGGSVFRLTAAGEYTTLYSFTGNNEGSAPMAPFIAGGDGFFYTTADSGGSDGGYGAIFRVDSDGHMTTLHILLNGLEGANPEGPLAIGPDGFFYGTTQSTVFRISPEGAFSVVHALAPSEARFAQAGLIAGNDGRLYGTAGAGGEGDAGSVYSMDTSGNVKVLHSFLDIEGHVPIAGLTKGPDGFLYGVNALGGKKALGTAYRMNTAGQLAVLHTFEGGDVGSMPGASLLFAPDGYLYGTTGALGVPGTVFRMTTTGTMTTLHVLGDPNSSPSALVAGPEGYLYGTTPVEGNGNGTVFRVSPSGDFSTFHSFSPDEASWPMAALVLASDGNFYGTASRGGASNQGTIFRMATSGVVTVIHSFDGIGGSSPQAALIQASDGLLYGTTADGGDSEGGTLFRISLDGSFTKLHDFSQAEGENPWAALVQASDGNLYGTTYQGGGFYGVGTVFRLGLDGTLITIHEFVQTDGSYPRGALVQANDGNLYGTSGLQGFENVYRIVLSDFAVTGATPACGPADGGTALMVDGAGFASEASLSIGGQGAAGVVRGPGGILGISPGLSPGTLNDVAVANPGASVQTLPRVFFADFLDVSSASAFHGDVERLVRYGISAGCGGGSFCPESAVTRAQMAVFLLRARHGQGWLPPPCGGIFADVACPGQFADWIEALAADGITGGCGGGNFCPNDPITRAQAAPLLLKAEHGPAYVPPACVGEFSDVSCPGLFADWIEQLLREDITAGCGSAPARYCAAAPVLRQAAATFLIRTFKLP